MPSCFRDGAPKLLASIWSNVTDIFMVTFHYFQSLDRSLKWKQSFRWYAKFERWFSCNAFSQSGKTYWETTHLIWLFLLRYFHSKVDALQCVKCDSETRSCASPEIVDCTGKCFTYHSVDRVGGTVISDLQKGCYPKEDVEISCSCEVCDTFQIIIGMFTDGKVDWSCKNHCCDDRDECNRHLHAPTCNEHSVYGFWILEKLKSFY